jgi:polysaccharide deacetylase family protein (PEP-CTERM system associated)
VASILAACEIQLDIIENAMTVDVEDYFHVSAFSGTIDRNDWATLEYRAETNTNRLLQLFADRGVSATFFVLGWVALRSPQLVKTIQRAGHEIASHGMSHKLIYNQTREEFARETAESKALLEDLTGEGVSGYRAASYSITRKSLWALDVLCELEFKYDSSIFPIRHDLYGMRDAPVAPARISAPSGASIVEFPLSTVNMLGVRVPVSGGGYFRLLPYALTHVGLHKLNTQLKRPFVFYLHPWEIDTGQPRIGGRWLSRFRHYTNIGRCEARLARLMTDFRFATMGRVLCNLGLLERPSRNIRMDELSHAIGR